MAPNLFRVLLALVALYAFVRGSRDERLAAFILVIGVIATHLVISPLRERFAGVETNVMTVDIIVFAGFLWVALRSQRFWPLWIAGLQLTTIFGHLLKLMDTSLFSRAYGAALVFWGYPILLILAVGTWRGRRRARADRDPAAT
jgi:nicotinamide riboside transporter PnuC